MPVLLAVVCLLSSCYLVQDLGYGFFSRSQSSELAGFSQLVMIALSILSVGLLLVATGSLAYNLELGLIEGMKYLPTLALFPALGLIVGLLRGIREVHGHRASR